MKKALVLLLALCTVAAFAQTPSVSGSATLTWGLDLNTNATGFLNAYSAKVTIPFAIATQSKGGEGTYGTISISNINFKLTDNPVSGGSTLGFTDQYDSDGDGVVDTAASISAKIVSGPLYMMVYNRSSLNFNKAADLLDGDVTNAALIDANTYGTKVGYDSELYDFGFIVNSKGDWTTNVDNEYAVGAVASIVAVKDLLTVNAGFSYDVTDATTGMGAYVTLPVTVGGLELTPAVDLDLTTGAASLFDARVDAAYTITEGLDAGLVVYYSDGDDDLEAEVSFTLDGLAAVEGLMVSAAFDYYNALNTATWEGSLDLEYTVTLSDDYYVMPYAYVTMDSADLITFEAGVSAKVIANTVFTLDYTSEDLTSAAADKGIITAKAKISL